MAETSQQSDFVRNAIGEISSWGGSNTGLVVEQLSTAMLRIKLGNSAGPQVLYVRATHSTSHLEPYINEPSPDEVEALKEGFTDPEDVIFPYLRGGRGLGMLLRVRNTRDLAAVHQLVMERGRVARARR